MDWLDPQNSLSSKIFADKHPNLIPVYYKSVFIESESLKIVLITVVWIVKIEELYKRDGSSSVTAQSLAAGGGENKG